jgi:D-alanine-D-alanine ligase
MKRARKINKKIRVAVLMGGPSAEHEVSLDSGKMIVKYFDKEKYIAKPIVISKKGTWPVQPTKLKNNFDIVFNALHGEYGEDGQVQEILELAKIPYTGADKKASKLGMDKVRCANLFKKAGYLTPNFVVVKKGQIKKIKNPFKYPVVVKPSDRGSSVGVTIVSNYNQLDSALKSAFKYSDSAMIQEFIKGREMTCGALEKGKKLIALMPIEIVLLKGKFYDYKAKYATGGSTHITPPKNISKKVFNEIKKIAKEVHKIVGAKDYSRTDMILAKDNKIYILEINTLPGMTKTSLVPDGAKAIGISFPELLHIIIQSALRTK